VSDNNGNLKAAAFRSLNITPSNIYCMKSIIGNRKGVIHFSAIILILMLIGVWYVFQSYRERRLVENMHTVYQDYKKWTMSVVKEVKDREAVEHAFNVIEGIVSKYGKSAPPEYFNHTSKGTNDY
jgi:hypothetical protein